VAPEPVRFLGGWPKYDVVSNESCRGAGAAASVSALHEALDLDVGPTGDETEDVLFNGQTALDSLRPPQTAVSEQGKRRYGAVDGDTVRHQGTLLGIHSGLGLGWPTLWPGSIMIIKTQKTGFRRLSGERYYYYKLYNLGCGFLTVPCLMPTTF